MERGEERREEISRRGRIKLREGGEGGKEEGKSGQKGEDVGMKEKERGVLRKK